MKKITLEIDDKFASLLTVSTVGHNSHEVNVTTCAVDITKYNRITIGHDGKAVFNHVED